MGHEQLSVLYMLCSVQRQIVQEDNTEFTESETNEAEQQATKMTQVFEPTLIFIWTSASSFTN